MSSANFELINVISDEANLDERSTKGCSWHYTDSFECILLGMALALLIHIIYIKYREHRAGQQKKKMAGL